MKDSPVAKILLLIAAALALLSIVAQHQQAQLPLQQLEQMNQQNEQMNRFLLQQMEQEMNNPLLTNPNGYPADYPPPYPGADPWQEQPRDDDWVD